MTVTYLLAVYRIVCLDIVSLPGTPTSMSPNTSSILCTCGWDLPARSILSLTIMLRLCCASSPRRTILPCKHELFQLQSTSLRRFASRRAYACDRAHIRTQYGSGAAASANSVSKTLPVPQHKPPSFLHPPSTRSLHSHPSFTSYPSPSSSSIMYPPIEPCASLGPFAIARD